MDACRDLDEENPNNSENYLQRGLSAATVNQSSL